MKNNVNINERQGMNQIMNSPTLLTDFFLSVGQV